MKYLVALGGNVGEVAETFCDAVHRMASVGLRPLALSRLYRTSALLWPESEPQPDYHNAVCLVDTTLAPIHVLAALQALEARAGPRGPGRWSARALDLDLVACKNLSFQSPALTLPHPRAHTRDFVLEPACDVAPQWPLTRQGDTVLQLLNRIPPDQRLVLERRLSWRIRPNGGEADGKKIA